MKDKILFPKILTTLATLLFLIGCSNDDCNNPDASVQDANSVYQIYLSIFATRSCSPDTEIGAGFYYWSDQTTLLDMTTYDDVFSLLTAYKKQVPLDRFSYITTVTADEDRQQGNGSGLGFSFRYTEDGDIEVTYVYPDSGTNSAGIIRGDILSDYDVEYDNYDNATRMTGTLNGTTSFEINAQAFDIEPLFGSKIIESNGKSIGYLYLTSFIELADERFTDQFQAFANSGIDELVIDLRYNGGGRISTANNLASFILNNSHTGQVFTTLKYNELYSSSNQNYFFRQQGDDLDLSRIFILTTQNSASASELMINGLKPYIDVIVVGEQTYGKPVGMATFAIDHYLFALINFEGVNANDEGGYFDGISPTPTCFIEDDTSLQLGEETEALFAGALSYIKTGSCVTASQTLQLGVPSHHTKKKPLENHIPAMFE